MSQIPLFEKKNEVKKEENALPPSNIGAWQKYTTGFGEKFMRKLGFEDRLGKDAQGIAQPIAIKKRPQSLGLGADGFKEASTLRQNREIAKEYNKNAGIAMEQETNKKEKKDWWKDTQSEESNSEYSSSDDMNDASESETEPDNSKMRKVKTRKIYKTMDQLIQEQQGEESEEIKPIVFNDYTGRQVTKRMINEASAINRSAVGFEMVYNLEMLVSTEEGKILQFGKKNQQRDNSKDEKQHLIDKLKSKSVDNASEIANLDMMTQRILQLISQSKIEMQSPIEILSFLEELQLDFPVEYYRYKIIQLLPYIFEPSIRKTFIDWIPLQESERFSELMDHVKDVILVEEEEDTESHLFNYDWMENTNQKHLNETRFLVTRVFTSTLLNRIKNSLEKMIDVFSESHYNHYRRLLATAQLLWSGTVLNDAMIRPVMVQLKKALEEWTPSAKFDQISFFAGILRYQAILPGFKVEIYPTLNYTFISYISSLSSLSLCLDFITRMEPLLTPFIDPTDTVARRQTSKNLLTSVITNAILPKLAASLHVLDINPGDQQHLELFSDVMAWCNWVDGDPLSAVLEAEFFLKWLDVLYDWTHQSNVVLREVVAWIQGWMEMFPAVIAENIYVIQQFNRGWDIINEILDGTRVIDPSLFQKPISYRSVLQNRRFNEKNVRIRDKIRQETRESSTMTLKDALSTWAEMNGIVLRQISGRTKDGKTLYMFGSEQFYIDDDVAFVRVNGDEVKWEPMSMQEMIDVNKRMEEDPLDLSVCYVITCYNFHII